MLRSELLTHLHAQFPTLTLRATEAMLDVLFAEISAALERGERVELRGFGAFSVRQRKARTGRNPRTGEEITIPAGHSVKVTAGSKLKAAASE